MNENQIPRRSSRKRPSGSIAAPALHDRAEPLQSVVTLRHNARTVASPQQSGPPVSVHQRRPRPISIRRRIPRAAVQGQLTSPVAGVTPPLSQRVNNGGFACTPSSSKRRQRDFRLRQAVYESPQERLQRLHLLAARQRARRQRAASVESPEQQLLRRQELANREQLPSPCGKDGVKVGDAHFHVHSSQ